MLHLVEKIRSQTQSKLLFLRWSRGKKTNRDASSGEIKLKKKKRIVAVSAHAERRLGGRRTANMFSLPHGRSRARTTDKTWEANELLVFLFFFNSSTAVTACRTWTPILSKLLIQVLEVVMAAHPGSFFLLRKCGKKKTNRLGSRQDGALLRRYSVQRRRGSNDLARAASLI